MKPVYILNFPDLSINENLGNHCFTYGGMQPLDYYTNKTHIAKFVSWSKTTLFIKARIVVFAFHSDDFPKIHLSNISLKWRNMVCFFKVQAYYIILYHKVKDFVNFYFNQNYTIY